MNFLKQRSNSTWGVVCCETDKACWQSKRRCVNAIRLAKAHKRLDRCFDEPHCASLVTLMRSRPSAACPCRALARWLFFPGHCVTGSLLSSAFIPYKALPEATCTQHEISGLRHSHSLPQSDLESSRQRWERRLLIGQKHFEWTQCSQGLSYEQRTDSSLASRCPVLTCAHRQNVKGACDVDVLTESRGCLDQAVGDGENQGADCHLLKSGRLVCHWRRMPYLCAVTHSGEHIQCWVVQLEFVGTDTSSNRNLYDRVRVCERTDLNVCQYMGLLFLFACPHLHKFNSKFQQHVVSPEGSPEFWWTLFEIKKDFWDILLVVFLFPWFIFYFICFV